ncbi:MAG: 5-methyltetrahydropteroyltriglutamate--homocysteine methyltransferase [Thermoprotei archaeon]
MGVSIAITGPYPRRAVFGKVVSRFLSNKMTKEEFDQAVAKEIEYYVKTMSQFNLDYYTAGLMRFDDPVDATVHLLKNVEKNGLVRFYDNNFYYRVPVIKGKLEPSEGEDYVKDLETTRKVMKDNKLKAKLKFTVMGPLSFALLSEDRHYKDVSAFMNDYASAINEFLKSKRDLFDAVEVIEPSFFQKGVGEKVIEAAKGAFSTLVDGLNREVHAIAYFNLRADRLEDFASLKADYYGFDLTEDRKKLAAFVYKAVKGKGVYLGLLDSRNTKMEKLTSLKRFVKGAQEAGAKDVIIGNSSLLDLIPEVIIHKKFKLASRLKGE